VSVIETRNERKRHSKKEILIVTERRGDGDREKRRW